VLERDPDTLIYRTRMRVRAQAHHILATEGIESAKEYLTSLGSYADVQQKAAAIFRSGGVEPVKLSPTLSEANVKSGSNTYLNYLTIDPASSSITDWACDCKWSSWNYERAPEFKYLEHRKCCHSLAHLYFLMSFRNITDRYLSALVRA
jgi:hypothetical protein